MTDINTLIDKDALEQLKNIDPKLALAELTSKLSAVTTSSKSSDNDEEEDSSDDDNDVPSHNTLKSNAQKEADEKRKKLREKIKNMSNARKGREFALKKDINMIKETAMMNNMGQNGQNVDVASIMMQMIGGMAQNSKQKKKMKKSIDKMMDKMES